MRLPRQILAVARATALEGLQESAVVLVALCIFAACALQPVLQLHAFGEPGRLARDGGMAMLLLAGVLASALAAGATVSGELRSGVAAAALSRPLSRASFIVGKWLGLCGISATLAWCITWAVLFAGRTAEAPVSTEYVSSSIRDVACAWTSCLIPVVSIAAAAWINARNGKRFGLCFFAFLAALPPLAALALGLFARDDSWIGFASWNPHMDFRVLSLAAPIFALLAVFDALAVFFAVFLPTGPAAALSFFALLLGFIFPAGAAIGIVPDASLFWLADDLAGGGRIALRTLAGTGVYAAALSVFYLALSSLFFGRRDL